MQRLRDHDRSLRLIVDGLEQLAELALGEEQAVGLVVGAVDRKPDVVEQRPGGHHYLGVAVAHRVVGDDRRLDVGPRQQAQEPQRHVDHDLDVDPRVVRHPEPFGGHLGHVPPRADLRVRVHRLEQCLQAAVAARRCAHLGVVDRLGGWFARRRAGAREARPVLAHWLGSFARQRPSGFRPKVGLSSPLDRANREIASGDLSRYRCRDPRVLVRALPRGSGAPVHAGSARAQGRGAECAHRAGAAGAAPRLARGRVAPTARLGR